MIPPGRSGESPAVAAGRARGEVRVRIAKRLQAWWRPRRKRALWGAFAVAVGLPTLLTIAAAVLPVPVTPLMLLRLSDGAGLQKDWVPLERMSPALAETVIAAEDNRFCSHHGFDLKAIRSAWMEGEQGGRRRGGSTISQQTAKNLFLWPGRSWVRKGLEAYLTLYVEALLSKRRILEIYLNVAEWAPGVYGAEAAARHHFKTSAARLTEQQAAQLAAVLPSPRRWNAGRPGPYIQQRSRDLVDLSRKLGPLNDCGHPPKAR